jgi:Leucine-rich repeat (LRR) protein
LFFFKDCSGLTLSKQSVAVVNEILPITVGLNYWYEAVFEILDVTNKALKCLENDLFVKYPNVNQIYMTSNSINIIPDNFFNGLTGLKTIDLSYNSQLEQLPCDFFKSQPSLESISVNNMNNLVFDDENIFQGLTNLQFLNLENNLMSYISPKLLRDQINLKTLKLFNNKLFTLDSTFFQSLANLELLGLSSNSFTSLPSGFFSGLVKIKSIRMKNNAISYIEPLVFSGLTALAEVYYSTNTLLFDTEYIARDILLACSCSTEVIF